MLFIDASTPSRCSLLIGSTNGCSSPRLMARCATANITGSPAWQPVANVNHGQIPDQIGLLDNHFRHGCTEQGLQPSDHRRLVGARLVERHELLPIVALKD